MIEDFIVYRRLELVVPSSPGNSTGTAAAFHQVLEGAHGGLLVLYIFAVCKNDWVEFKIGQCLHIALVLLLAVCAHEECLSV